MARASTTYAYEPTRNVATQRVEAAGTPIARTISLEWHPQWNRKTAKAEPLRLTTWVYNGQPDPTNGGATASCAPSAALLPNGSPIAVLCKKVEQATTDTSGAQGFSATVTGAPRVWTYTYNQNGQVLTATGPRGNLATSDPNYAPDTTSYVYYPGYVEYVAFAGDLQQVTNGLGQVTKFTTYDPDGRLEELIDPNGVYTALDYDVRGSLTDVTVEAPPFSSELNTSYSFNDAEELVEITLPDFATLKYTYDVAHRVTAVTDRAGNSIGYTLDAMGNRVLEQVKDPTGNLSRQIARVYDQLNRLQQVTGGLQ
jgi:YD repeat-containing protein